MAGRIAGITIEIGGNTTNLQKALKGVDTQLKTTQNNLKDINKLLKLDPTNTELLTQKQKNLENAIAQTKERLETLKQAQSQVAEGSTEWDSLQREIIETEQHLDSLKEEYRNFGSVAIQQIKAASEKMKDLGSKIQDVGKQLSKISGAAAGALTALGGIAYKSLQSADDLNTLSRQTGLTTDTLQKMKYAQDLVDVGFDTMTGAISKLERSMTGHGATWEQLGVSVTDASGQMRGTEEVFFDVLQALSQVGNETERDQLAMDIFGKSANDLAGIIDDGGKALKEYGQEAENMGLILDTETINKLNEANDTVDKLKVNMSMSFGQLGATLLETFGPALEKASGFIEKLTENIRNLSPEQAEMIVKILAVLAVLGPLMTVIGSIISVIGTLMTVIPLLAGPIGLVVAAIAAVIAIGITLYKHWDDIKAWATETADTISNKWNELKDNVVNAVENIKTKVTTTWDNIKTKVGAAVTILVGTVTTAWDNLKTAISTAVDAVKAKIDSFKEKLDSLKTKAQSVIDRVKQIFSGEISLPRIKLPHFSINGNFSLNPPKVPSFNVQWYRKAYDNPVMFTSPTVLGTANGMKGFGDGHGAEIVMGLNKLRELVGQTGVVINVYPSAGMNETELAQIVQNKLVQLQKQRDLAYA